MPPPPLLQSYPYINAGGDIFLAITPFVPVLHNCMTSLLVGAGAKHEASPNARRRDASDASGRLVGGVGRGGDLQDTTVVAMAC